MPNEAYPSGTVQHLLQTDFVTPATKAVLNERLQLSNRVSPSFFDEESFRLLEAVCDCLLPQKGKSEKIPLALMVEKDIATGKGRGWRYLELPPIKEAMRHGIKAIDAEAKEHYGKAFVDLSIEDKNALLTIIQQGQAKARAWEGLPSNLFFTELLATATEQYYSHPLAKEEIGDVSLADNGGWQHLGLNNLEAREPQTLSYSANAKP